MTFRDGEYPWNLSAVRSDFNDWRDRQHWPSMEGERCADSVVRYLERAERGPLPAPMLRGFAQSVEALAVEMRRS